MRLIISYLLIFLSFISCQDEVKFNTPGFETLKNDVFWRATVSKASLKNGILTIEGATSKEKISLQIAIPATSVVRENQKTHITYILDENSMEIATYVLASSGISTLYSTNLGLGEGQITITDYNTINKTISGTFTFLAEDNVGLLFPNREIVNFVNGNFYQIPIK